jgi:hypothetical protein
MLERSFRQNFRENKIKLVDFGQFDLYQCARRAHGFNG